ncbi:MAG: hypothetical protein ACK5MY_17380 [Jhaorihella sp.]
MQYFGIKQHLFNPVRVRFLPPRGIFLHIVTGGVSVLVDYYIRLLQCIDASDWEVAGSFGERRERAAPYGGRNACISQEKTAGDGKDTDKLGRT